MKRIAVLALTSHDFMCFAGTLPDARIYGAQARAETAEAVYQRVQCAEDVFGAEWDGIERLGDWYRLPDSGRLEHEILARMGRRA